MSLVQPIVTAERRRPPPGGRQPPSDDELAPLLAEISARNLSRAYGPLLPGVDAVAAPVFDYRDRLVAVICVVGRSGAMNMRWNGPAIAALIEAASNLSQQLGHVDTSRAAKADQLARSKRTREKTPGRKHGFAAKRQRRTTGR
jgi:DNA-binding IclR family transcriptional regulator